MSMTGSPLYTEGHVFGIDVSSGAAVHVLGVQPTDHVLDLCCAPGAKLCMLSKLTGGACASIPIVQISYCVAGGGSVTGVDVSMERLSSCRTLVDKYACINVRLVLGDGTSFDAPPPSYQPPLLPPVPQKKQSRRQKKQLHPMAHCQCSDVSAVAELDDDKDGEVQAAEAAPQHSCPHRQFHRSRGFSVTADPALCRLYDKVIGLVCISSIQDLICAAGDCRRRVHARRFHQSLQIPVIFVHITS